MYIQIMWHGEWVTSLYMFLLQIKARTCLDYSIALSINFKYCIEFTCSCFYTALTPENYFSALSEHS